LHNRCQESIRRESRWIFECSSVILGRLKAGNYESFRHIFTLL
jgi:hypothetical protein